jgi:hypothetical protein
VWVGGPVVAVRVPGGARTGGEVEIAGHGVRFEGYIRHRPMDEEGANDLLGLAHLGAGDARRRTRDDDERQGRIGRIRNTFVLFK